MKRISIIALAALAFCSCARQASDVTPGRSAEAARLLTYVDSIFGKQILSSTMANVAWNTAEADLVFDTLGKRTAMIGLDYMTTSAAPYTICSAATSARYSASLPPLSSACPRRSCRYSFCG